ncbi:DUF2461 domain-containing protein [Maioricimonas sp. JC845]|uniref:DUF2461 domain-containing protein n=1 Tax=Maioricimonas sp. JC845 TaxID=3232138 RepID=UPI00345A3692
MPDGFSGFPPELLQFLSDLARNNDRDWFAQNRDRYDDHLVGPAMAYIAAMQKPLARLAPALTARPKRVGGSLMRIHRDVRFSKDKSPYKTNVGIQFRHEAGKDVHAPGFYLHIEPDQAFFGVGIWHPDGDTLRAIRTAIAERPADWKKAKTSKAFRSRYQLAGDSLKRAPKDFAPDHPQIEDLKRKDFIAIQELDPSTLTAPGFVAESTDALKAARPFMRFLCEATGVAY